MRADAPVLRNVWPGGRLASSSRLALRVRGPGGDRELELDLDIIKLGKDARSHVHLDHPEVSRMHAVIERSRDGFDVIDLGNEPGTGVNGKRTNKARLVHGDMITIGPFNIAVAIATR